MQRFEPIYHASAVVTTGGGRWWRRHGLPVRPRPHPGEWAYGYLVRVAEANGYESPRALWRGLGPRRTGSSSSVRYALRLSPAEWRFLSGPWPRFCRVEQVLAEGLAPSDYCHDHLRWCPHCLAEQRLLRARWVIKLCVACPEHGCYLRDTCAVCHQYQRPERAVLDRCLCGASLIGIPAERIAEDELRLQLAFQGALAGQAQEGAPSLSVAAWITLFHRVAALFDVERETRSGQTPGLHRLDRAIVVNRQLASLLAAWPSGFHRCLGDLQRRAEPSFSLVRTFGRLYRWLYRDFEGDEFAFLREAFEDYLREHWWGLLCRRNRRLGTRTPGSRKTAQAIAAAAGTTPARVRQLHLAGWVEADIAAQPSGRRVWSFPASQVEPLATLISDGLTLQDAAAYLRLSKHRVRELIATGMIKPLLSTEGHGAATWLISRHQLDDLGRAYSARQALVTKEEPPDCVPLVQILKAWRLEAGAFAALLHALQSGVLTPIATRDVENNVLGGLLLPRREVQAWLAHWRESNGRGYSITDAAGILGIKAQVAYHLVRCGLLESTSSPLTQVRRVSRDGVAKFEARYISLVEIAKRSGTAPKQALLRLQIHPAAGPAIDGCRQYFYLRSDVEHLLDQPLQTQESGNAEP